MEAERLLYLLMKISGSKWCGDSIYRERHEALELLSDEKLHNKSL